MAIPTPMSKVIPVNLDFKNSSISNWKPFNTGMGFWTNDIGTAFLEFSTELDLTGTVASIVLENQYDKSLVQKTITEITSSPFYYQLGDEIQHEGRWFVQISVKKGEETIVSNSFAFMVNASIGHGKVARLVSIETFETLATQLTALQTDISNYLETAETNEAIRVSTYDEIVLAEETRKETEDIREANDISRGATATADNTRANTDHSTAVFDHSTALTDHSTSTTDHTTALADHSIASSDHSTAVTDHTRANTDHTTALADHTSYEGLLTDGVLATNIENKLLYLESTYTPELLSVKQQLAETQADLQAGIGAVTVDAEVVTARSSTLKGKTFTVLDNRLEEMEEDALEQKVKILELSYPMENFIPDGAFNTLSEHWESVGTTLTTSNGRLISTGNATTKGTSATNYLPQPIKVEAGDRIYWSVNQKTPTSVTGQRDIVLRVLHEGVTPIAQTLVAEVVNDGIEKKYSGVYTYDGQTWGEISYLRFNHYYEDILSAVGDVEISKPFAINLTKTFEDGSVTTAADMDSILSRYPDSWFDGIENYVNLKDLFNLTKNNADMAINVKKFGAVGDGIVDDTLAIQAIFDSLPNNGGSVYFPAGDYLIPNGGLICEKPVNMIGVGTGLYEGGGSRLITTSPTATLLTLTSPCAVVTGITFESKSLTRPTASVGLFCTDFDWGRIERCMFIGFWNNAQVDSGYFYSFSKCVFLRPINIGLYMRNTAIGQFDHGDQIIEGCNFSKYGDPINGGTALRWESGGGLRLVGNKVNAGTQPGYPDTGFFNYGFITAITAATSSSTSVNVISSNSVEGFLIDGIKVSLSNNLVKFGKVTIVGNELLASGNQGFAINCIGSVSGGYYLDNVAITGNVAYGTGAGLQLNSVEKATVIGNDFFDCVGIGIKLYRANCIEMDNNLYSTSIVDDDASMITSQGGRDRSARTFRKNIQSMNSSSYYGKVQPANYSAGLLKVKVFGNVSTVGSVRVEHIRAITRLYGSVVVEGVIGTDILLGVAKTELSLSYDTTTDPGYVKVNVTSVNGKAFTGGIEVTYDGLSSVFSYAN